MEKADLDAIIAGVTANIAPAATAPAATAGWTDQAKAAQSRGGATRVPRKPSTPAAEPKDMTEARALIAQLRSGQRTISLKVSEKGAVSVYGLGRFPVTLYASQMSALLDTADAIRSFMVAHKSQLTTRE